MIMANKPSLAVLISGNGSNLQAIIDAVTSGNLNAHIAVVISDNPSAYGLTRANTAQIKTEVLSFKQYATRQDFDNDIKKTLLAYHVDFIVLAGFMRILGDDVVQMFRGKMINIHPSLLPKFPGLNTHERVLNTTDSEHGVSIHFVTEQLDGGPIIAQARCAIHKTDDAAALKERIHHLEHQLYPLVLTWLCDNKIQLLHNQVQYNGKILPEMGIQVPLEPKNRC